MVPVSTYAPMLTNDLVRPGVGERDPGVPRVDLVHGRHHLGPGGGILRAEPGPLFP
jgi:hypothetical protein